MHDPFGKDGRETKRFFTAELYLGDPFIRRIRNRPGNSDDVIIDNINRTLGEGDRLYILGGLFDHRDTPTGFARGAAWMDDDFDIPARLALIDRINPAIGRVLVLANTDDESFLRHFNDQMLFESIMPFISIELGGSLALLSHDTRYGALDPHLPLIYGAPEMGSSPVGGLWIGVNLDLNGLMPVSEEDIAAAIAGRF